MFTVSVAAAAWQVSRVFMYLAVDERTALRWARVGFACAILLAPAVYQFVDTILENATHRRVVSVLAWLIAAQFAVIALTTGYLVGEVHRYSWGFYPRYDNAARVIYPLFCGTVLAAAIVDIVRAYPASRGTERNRIRLFTIAIGVACLAAIDFLPAYGVAVYPLGWAAFLASTGIVLYALRKYGLEVAASL